MHRELRRAANSRPYDVLRVTGRRGRAPALHRQPPWDGRPHGAAPTAEIGPVPLARQVQARRWNRIRHNFPHTQGPVARRKFRTSLRFCAPEMFCPPQGVTPVTGDRG